MTEISEIKMHNTPDSHGVSIEQVGTEPKITYHVDWQEMKHPTPQMFHGVSDAQVTLATMGTYIQNESVGEEYDDAMQAVNTLLHEMVKARDLDTEEAKQSLYMGNLHELPEVEKESEQVPVGENDE